MRYVTNDFDLYRDELKRLADAGREIVSTRKYKL